MIKKLRFYLLIAAAFIRRDRRRIAFGITVTIVLAFLLKIFIPTATPTVLRFYKELVKPSFIEAAVGVPPVPNPIFDSSQVEKDISSLIFRGLLRLDQKGNLIPDLAESYKKESDTEYIFNLRRDIYWHDGTSFTSEDVVYTVEAARDPAYGSEVASNFKDVTVEKIDSYTVSFKLKEPFSPFPYATTIGIIPKHIGLKKYKPIGTGPFKVKQVTKDKVVLTDDRLNIIFKFYKKFSDARLALIMGEVHALSGFTPYEAQDIEKYRGRAAFYQVFPFRQIVALFNTRDPQLAKKDFRQALSYSIDKQRLKITAGGEGAVLSTSQLPKFSFIESPKDTYPFNLEEAKKNLEKAGLEFRDGAWFSKEGKVSLTITSLDDAELNSVVNFLKQSWIDIGFKVESVVVSPDELRRGIIPNRNFQVLVNFQEISPDPDQYVLWHTIQAQTTNITGIRSPKLDKLLEDARKSGDQKVRAEKYKLFTTLLLDEAPAIFLYYPSYIWVVSNKVAGIDLSDFGVPADRFNSYQKWQFKRGFF